MNKLLLILVLIMTFSVVINRAQEEADDSAGVENIGDDGSAEGTDDSETPVAPSAPIPAVAPSAPIPAVAPSAPSAPVRPVAPIAPVRPVAPIAPVRPVAPIAPVRPVAPVAPVAPVEPSENIDESAESSTPVVHSSNPVVLRRKFIREALRAHNRLRALHGVPRLVHNPELSIMAQKHARFLANHNTVANSNLLFHGERVGENIMSLNDISLVRYPGGFVTRKWYRQGTNYDYSGDHQPGTGLFTQIIWKGTREVGFGVRKTPDGRYYFVSLYYPAGNVLGQFGNNVLPPIAA